MTGSIIYNCPALVSRKKVNVYKLKREISQLSVLFVSISIAFVNDTVADSKPVSCSCAAADVNA